MILNGSISACKESSYWRLLCDSHELLVLSWSFMCFLVFVFSFSQNDPKLSSRHLHGLPSLRLSSGGHALQSLPKESWVNHESGAHQQLTEAARGEKSPRNLHPSEKRTDRDTWNMGMNIGSPLNGLPLYYHIWMVITFNLFNYPHINELPLSNYIQLSHPKRISDFWRLSPWASIHRFSCEGPVDVDRFFPRSYVARNGIWRVFHPTSSHLNAILTKGTLRYDKSMWWKRSIIDVIVWGKGEHTRTYTDIRRHVHTHTL